MVNLGLQLQFDLGPVSAPLCQALNFLFGLKILICKWLLNAEKVLTRS